jgi:iron complex outermembrane receptor protein
VICHPSSSDPPALRRALRAAPAIVLAVLGATRAGVARAAPGEAGGQAPPPCAGTLDGHAVDAATHQPVAGATVRIADRVVAVSDDAGRFTLTELCAGQLAIVVERDDYQPAERAVTVAAQVALEIAMTGTGEVIAITERAPPPTEMRSTAVLSGAQLERTRGKTFSDVLADVPGVAELRGATGVAKPIIRGQLGRRLLILVDGVRHRAQEWGLDHAPEIDPFIADQIRVVRGPGSVRYGSDAIGGAVLVDPPEPRRAPGYGGEAHLIGISNGRGGAFAGRLQGVLAQLPAVSAQLEGSVKRLAAPETPGYALANAGLFEWSAGATLAARTAGAEYRLSYRHYDADLGVCACLRVHSVDDFLAQARAGQPIGADELRTGFHIARPYQAVGHDLVLLRGRWDRDHLGTFTASYSFQRDLRREYEVVRNAETAGAQFRFQLMTHEVDAVFEHDPIHLSEHWHVRGAAGLTGNVQLHDFSGLHLVPSYTAAGAGAYATERLVGHATELELGARYDVLTRTATIERIDFTRLVRSGQLARDACGAEIDPARCRSRFRTSVVSLGALRRLGDAWSVKAELSRAARAPTPDEQYLDGAAPTFPVLGLGKPDVAPETTYASSVTLAHTGDTVTAEASAYASRIADYIAFGPAIGGDGRPVFDVTIRGTFPRFTTRSVDAVFYGADGGLALAPLPAIELGAQASLVRAHNASDGSYLPLVPADHYRGSITYHPPDLGALHKISLTVSGTYVARQRRSDPRTDFVAPPPGYVVLGAELRTETAIADRRVGLALQGTNLSNARFRDYTSLARYFADEPGWQAVLQISLFLDSTKKGP